MSMEPDIAHLDKQAMPALEHGIGFNAQHSPMGAFMSFTCGCPFAGCGLGVEIGKPADQNVFVGIKRGKRQADIPIQCLPFFRDAGEQVNAASNYDVENPNAAQAMRGLETIPLDQVKRYYGWASDTWAAPGFTFRVYSPFGSIPDPEADGSTISAMRKALRSAVIATLEVDNRKGGEVVTGVFGIDFIEPGVHLLRDAAEQRGPAFAYRRHMGLAAQLEGGKPGEQPQPLQKWSIAEGLLDPDPVFVLGTCGGFSFEVMPGEKRTLVVALGVYLENIVTTGIEARYLYTRYFASLEDVLDSALAEYKLIRRDAETLDQELLTSNLSADQQFQLAHATRGYYGSTQLLDVAGKPMWGVNEGEYCMLNTLDLSIDQSFWELKYNPWVVRNLLDQFAGRYRYQADVKDRAGNTLPGGVSFTHDVGANNHFTPPGYSSYERPGLTGCFSYMMQEQLCNWVLLVANYVATTGDSDWLENNRELLTACAQSMRNRADRETGVMAYDSARCGSGSEITTYDSLDDSLGQARANTYIAVKCWATWLALELLGVARADEADRIADHLCRRVKPDGTLPAVLEEDNPGYDSRIIPVIEALVYPDYWMRCLAQHEANPTERKRLAIAMQHPFVNALKQHTRLLLEDERSRNIFKDGGMRLSSTSGNSWMSKIAICQYVMRHVLHMTDSDASMQKRMQLADRAHALWQINGSAYWASSDQFVFGVAKGSRYYPRMVTTILWMQEELKSVSSGTTSNLVASP